NYMNTSHELIERYVHGMLTAEEQQRFEQMLAGDPLLAEQVRIEQSLLSAVARESAALTAAGGTTVPGNALLAQLQATPAQTVLAGSAAAAGGKVALLLGNPWIVNVLAGVALAGAVTGAFFIAPLLRQPPDRHLPAVQRDTVYVPVAPAPVLPAVQQDSAPPSEPLRRISTVPEERNLRVARKP